MMKNNDISRRDWEMLSAYIDGQLTPVESTRLEERLQARADLRAAVESLRRTQIVLRSQGKVRAPRNFTLTPELAGIRPAKKQPSPLFPVFRLASALASILLVLVLFSDFLVGGSLSPLSRSAGEAVPQIEAVEIEREGEPVEEPKFLMQEEAQEEVPEEAAEAEMPADSRAMQLPAGTPEIGEEVAQPEEAAAEAAAPEAEKIQPTQTPLDVEGITATSEVAAAPLAEESQADQAFTPTPEALKPTEIAAAERSERPLPESEGPSPTSVLSPWRLVEIALAGLALVFGLIAFYLRRAG